MTALYKFDFTKSEYEYIISECCFTDEEIEVFKLRRNGYSIIEMAFKLKTSESTISRRIKGITRKVKKII